MEGDGEQVAGEWWVGTTDAAAYLGITPRTINRLIDDGEIPAYRIGRVIRLRIADLDAFIEASRIIPGSITYLHDPDPDVDGAA